MDGSADVHLERAVLEVPEQSEPDSRTHGRTPSGRGDLAGGPPVPEDQFATPEHGVWILQAERHQSPPDSLGPGPPQSGPAEEVDVAGELAGEQQAGLQRIQVRVDVPGERAVPLLQA